MSKMRFNISYNNKDKDIILYYASINSEIIMRHIESVIINGKKYKKSTYDLGLFKANSNRIMKFYQFILGNLKNVTEIVTHAATYRLKNGVLHSDYAPSYENTIFSIYFIDGNRVPYDEWIIYRRKNKLKKIINLCSFFLPLFPLVLLWLS